MPRAQATAASTQLAPRPQGERQGSEQTPGYGRDRAGHTRPPDSHVSAGSEACLSLGPRVTPSLPPSPKRIREKSSTLNGQDHPRRLKKKTKCKSKHSSGSHSKRHHAPSAAPGDERLCYHQWYSIQTTVPAFKHQGQILAISPQGEKPTRGMKRYRLFKSLYIQKHLSQVSTLAQSLQVCPTLWAAA